MGYYVPAIKQFVGLADSNMCTLATAARDWRDKICLVCPCLQQMPGQGVWETPTTTSGFILIHAWGPVLAWAELLLCWRLLLSAGGKVCCTIWSSDRDQTASHCLMFHYGVIFPHGTWIWVGFLASTNMAWQVSPLADSQAWMWSLLH